MLSSLVATTLTVMMMIAVDHVTLHDDRRGRGGAQIGVVVVDPPRSAALITWQMPDFA